MKVDYLAILENILIMTLGYFIGSLGFGFKSWTFPILLVLIIGFGFVSNIRGQHGK